MAWRGGVLRRPRKLFPQRDRKVRERVALERVVSVEAQARVSRDDEDVDLAGFDRLIGKNTTTPV
jgi:hypothetical protein